MLVPASWPVYDLSAHPTVCVRFDRHAVYVGHPSSDQRCPAHAAGRTEAILVEPLSAHVAGEGAAAGNALPAVTNSGAQPRHGTSARLVLPTRGVVVTATWGSHPGVLDHALGMHAVAAAGALGTPAAHDAAATAPHADTVARAAALYKGLGFDACSAPSAAHMSAWLSSPYRAVGIYIGGTNMACAQPNRTAAWVARESAAGWHLIPTYVGLQAPGNSCGCAAFSPRSASSQGAAAANDAVNQAQTLGIGRGNPIYFDLEAYSRGGSTTSAVLAFLGAWTSTLHSHRYLSGVYSSASSGVRDLVAAFGTGFDEPDDIWIADWNGVQSTSDPYVPSGDWPSHRRLHQYEGAHNATYGHITLNIDSSYVDGATASASPPIPDGTFVQVAGSAPIYRIAGGAPLYLSGWAAIGSPQPVMVISKTRFASLKPLPTDGTFLVTGTGKIFRVAGGAPFAVSSWSVFGGVKPSVTIDQWDIDHISNPKAHLHAKPADGTVVEGLPSHSYWSFTAGYRAPTNTHSGAVAVDDAGIPAFPLLPAGRDVVRCVVPRLRHMTLGAARRALRRANCRLGKVRRARRVGPHRVQHVIGQSPAPRTSRPAGYRVGVLLW